MGTVITSAAATITPTIVLGYEADREAGNKIHPILGRSGPDVTLRPAGLRTGTLELGFLSEADAAEAVAILAVGGVFAVVSDERATAEMVFVLAGRGLGHAIESVTRDAWLVSVGYQEVAA